ncbi:XRE family transcriptional regulator, partial [Enterococcus faecium]
LLDISVDQFFFPCNEDGDNNRRKQVDVLLNDMEEKELIVMEAGLVALYDRPSSRDGI